MKKHYGFGNVRFALITDEDFKIENNMLPFLTEPSDNEICCFFDKTKNLQITPDDNVFSSPSVNIFGRGECQLKTYTLPLMNKPSAVVTEKNGRFNCLYEEKNSEYFLKDINLVNTIGIEQIAYAFKTYILHCSFIEYKGKAVLFTGVSGIGKSTRAEMWVNQSGATIINGDKAGLYFNNGVLYACGLPVAGSSNVFLNKCLPVDSIVILKKSFKNNTRKATLSEAMKQLYFNMIINTWNIKFCEEALSFTFDLFSSTNVYVSECNLERDSIKEQLTSMRYLNDRF